MQWNIAYANITNINILLRILRMSLASHQMTIAWDETLVSYLPLQCVNDVSEANVCPGLAGEGVPDRP